MVSARLGVGTLIGAFALTAWVLTVLNIGLMMGTPSLPIDIATLLIFVSAWTVGMVAMMFPTAMPMLMMLLHVGRTSKPDVKAGGGPNAASAVTFVGTYLGIWVATGAGFFVGAAILFGLLPLSATVFIATPVGIGLALLVVAAYQLSPVKGECLFRCHPTSFLFKYYRGGIKGSVRMGYEYAKYCVGCCWVMMVFLLVSASMGLVWMAGFAAVIFAERTLPLNKWVPRLFGLGFLAAGSVLILT
ncbi:MAG: DUF2182 domain-containing protein [archaeon]|nr:MAG: DUF2182 domain-containing protein [archaeon]